jgi:hypothetical protein
MHQHRVPWLFAKRQAKTAKYVTSVCTGAFVLGTAGLLRLDRLGLHETVGSDGRDSGVLPGGAGRRRNCRRRWDIRHRFRLHDRCGLAGEDVAQSIQLAIEYDPALPIMPATRQGRRPRTAHAWTRCSLCDACPAARRERMTRTGDTKRVDGAHAFGGPQSDGIPCGRPAHP